jgi:Alginate lyase
MGVLLFIVWINSHTEIEWISLAAENNMVNTSSIVPIPITISNGQMLSHALLLDPAILLPAKQALQNNANGNSVLQNSLKQLIAQANAFVFLKPTSVVEKHEIPGSDDKHDFLSLAPYRWPDPDKPDGLPYVNIDGRLNPEVNLIPDKKNMDDMVYRVKILSLAYYFTNNLTYASKAEELLRVWFLNNSTRMNPNLQYAEMVRGQSNGTMRGILHGKYLPEVFDAIRLIRDSPSWSTRDQQGIEQWFTEYLNWLLHSRHGEEERRLPNNHGTWYRIQVVSIALSLNKTDIAKSLIQKVWNELIENQIDADGSLIYETHRKNALDYSTFNVLGLFKLATLGESLGIDLWNQKTREGAGLQKALDYLLQPLLGKGTWPHSQIKLIDRKNMVDLFCRAAMHYQKNQTYIEACKTASIKPINIALSHPP